MSKYVLLGALAIGLFAFVNGLGGLAVFTDQEAIDANDFDTLDVDISTAPTTAMITMSGMIPGDSVTDDVVVSNDGDLDLRYAISSSATNTDTLGLKDALTLTINTIDVTTPGTPCDDFDGTQLYTGDVDSTAGVLVGDPAQGPQAGDRALAPTASETLCFRVELSSAATGPDGASTSATFIFDAEQTVNNP
jgi:hypothetical protein